MKIIIQTKGVKGQPQFQKEFFTNLPRVLGTKPLEEYAANVADQMQQDAPVLTGYLRNNIQSYRVDPFSMSVNAWAPYSGWAEIYSHRPHYFQSNTFSSANIGGQLMRDASRQYARTLINKYQRGP